MNTLTRTIIVFVAINSMTAGLALAQEIEDPALPVLSSGTAVVGTSASVSEPDHVESFATGTATNVGRTRLLTDPLSSRSRSTGPVLVIPVAEIKTEDIIAITEDVSVMSRIFERSLQQARISAASGSIFQSRRDSYLMLLGRGRSEIQSMYLQGYGALFLMTVDFPLSPGPQVQEEKQTQEDEDVDPVWDGVRREMYEPEETRRRTTGEPEEKYDAEKVENLKNTLIKTLKHAANIRNLKPDESLVLRLTGSGGSAALVGDVTSAKRKIFVVDSGGNTRIIEDMSPGGAAALFPTVLVMRAKKSDIDEFAKGDLDLDQFRQRVQVLACPYLGSVAGSEGFQAYKYTGATLPSSGRELDF